MSIQLDGLTIQCLRGSLATQPAVDGLVVFLVTWLKPFGTQAEEVHDAGGQRLHGACAEAGPLILGNVAIMDCHGLPPDKLVNCVVVSIDSPHPEQSLAYRCTLDALRQADELGLRSVATSPIGDLSRAEGSAGLAVLSAIASLSGHTRHLDVVRIVVPDDQSCDLVSMKIVREASRQEKGAA